MLSSSLVSKYAKYMFIGGKDKVLVSPEDVYDAATEAQLEILRDLRLLQEKTTIVFPSVETCQRQKRDITAVSGTTTVLVTTSEAHGYQTGEEYIIQGVAGITGVNGRRTITVISTTQFTLDNTTGAGTYTSGGTAYPIINSMIDLIGGRQISPNNFILTRVDYDKINNDRDEFGTSSPAESVFRISYLDTDPATIVVQGIPETTVKAEIRFFRIPMPNEDISSTVNPILPDRFKRLLELGTLTFIYEDRDEVEAIDLATKQRLLFEKEKARVQMSVARLRIRNNSQPRNPGW